MKCFRWELRSQRENKPAACRAATVGSTSRSPRPQENSACRRAPPGSAYLTALLILLAALSPMARAVSPRDAYATPAAAKSSSDSAAVAAVVDSFHRALAAGDSAGALALLAEDAVIVESGAVESRREYRSHHLPADIAFARAIPGTRRAVQLVVRGNTAWVTSTSTVRGSYRGKPVNSSGAELMVLTRAQARWKISAVHWSSRDLP